MAAAAPAESTLQAEMTERKEIECLHLYILQALGNLSSKVTGDFIELLPGQNRPSFMA